MSCSTGDGDINDTAIQDKAGSQLSGEAINVCGTAVTQEASTRSHQQHGHTSNDAHEAQYGTSFDTRPNHGVGAEITMNTHESHPGQSNGNSNGRPDYLAVPNGTDTEMTKDAQVEATKQSTQGDAGNETDPETSSILQKLKDEIQSFRVAVTTCKMLLCLDYSQINDETRKLFSKGAQALPTDGLASVLWIFRLQELEMEVLAELKSFQSVYRKAMSLLKKMPIKEEEREEVKEELEETYQEMMKLLRGTFMN